jgi:hypothetical protein
VTGWRGLAGPYDSLYTGNGDKGGGLEISRLRPGQIRPLTVYVGGGGGRVQSTAEPLAGFGGAGGPGPGAMIGLS